MTAGLLATPSDTLDLPDLPGLPDPSQFESHVPPPAPTPWEGPSADRVEPAPPGAELPPPLPVRPVERFEVIWPTGEIDDVSLRPDHEGRGSEPAGHHDEVTGADEPHDDDGAIAVRRAVATIDTGSLAARRRLVESTVGTSPDDEPWPTNGLPGTTGDTDPVAPALPAPRDAGGNGSSPTEDRAGALRRLISSLRR
jgi:hypothetical protein